VRQLIEAELASWARSRFPTWHYWQRNRNIFCWCCLIKSLSY